MRTLLYVMAFLSIPVMAQAQWDPIKNTPLDPGTWHIDRPRETPSTFDDPVDTPTPSQGRLIIHNRLAIPWNLRVNGQHYHIEPNRWFAIPATNPQGGLLSYNVYYNSVDGPRDYNLNFNPGDTHANLVADGRGGAILKW